MNETALQSQARLTREKAAKIFDSADLLWLRAEDAHEENAKTLPSYKEAKRLFAIREQRKLDLNRAIEAEDQINGTNYAPKNEVVK